MTSHLSQYYLSPIKEIYHFRSLLENLVMRELKARYRGSMLGFLWSLLNPLLLMSIYTIVFSLFLKDNREAYVVYLCSGLLPWLWFSSSLLESSGAVIAGGNLIKKVVFPAEILPLVVVFTNLVNFLTSLPILLLFCIVFKRFIGPSIIMLPVVISIQWLLSSGLALILSALCVQYRDIQHVLGHLMTFWFFMTPIVYPLQQIPDILQFTVYLNPVAPLIFAYQDIFYYRRFPNGGQLAVAAVIGFLVYLLGTSIFERNRETFAAEI